MSRLHTTNQPSLGVRARALLLSLLALGTGPQLIGCTALNRPKGGGYESIVAQNVMRMSIVTAFDGADFSQVVGRTFRVSATGFGMDQENLKLYLLHTARMKALDAGGIEAAGEATMHIELFVHAAGILNDQTAAAFSPLYDQVILQGETYLDVLIRDEQNTLLSRQTLRAEARETEGVALTFFSGPSVYAIRRDGRWKAIDPVTKIAPPLESATDEVEVPTPGYSSPWDY